jgi:signal transduction histidine kinase
MEHRDGSPIEGLDRHCLATLAHALRAADADEAALRLLQGLCDTLGASGGLVAVHGESGARVLAELDLPKRWVDGWRSTPSGTLDARFSGSLIRESLGVTNGVIETELKLSGVRTQWVLPLAVGARATGALVLVARKEEAFPEDVRPSVETTVEAFAGWLRGAALPDPDSASPTGSAAAPTSPTAMPEIEPQDVPDWTRRWARTLLDALGVSAVVLDPGGRVRALGAGWTTSPDEVADAADRHFSDLLDADRREVLAALRTTARQGRWHGTLVSGGLPVEMTLHAVRSDAGHLEAIVGVRQASEQATARDLIRRMPVGVLLLDSSLRVMETNPELAIIFGAANLPENPTGLDVRSLEAFQTRSAQSALDELLAIGRVEISEVQLSAGDHPRVPVQLRGTSLTADGGVSGYVVTVVSRAGGTDLERQLMRAHKMESIGNFASGLAHDFGNFVSVILGKAGMLRVKLPDDPHIVNDLEDIETAAKRAQHLAQELMKFARGGRSKVERLDINGLVREVGALIRTSIGKRINLDLRLEAGVPEIQADPVEIQQLVLNLCLNSRDAMPNGGKLIVETRPLNDSQRAALQAGDDATDGVCLRVRDSGEGMPPEILERIFEPFYTTKEDGQKGSGLGLAMVYGIVRRHGGIIDVQSRPGLGTTFEILLPAAAVADERTDGKPILVVDDEPAFREMIQLILEEEGYRVEAASDGIEALRTLRDRWQELALVIVDLRMPGLDGLGLLDELRRFTKDLPVLVTTGYAGPEEKDAARKRGALVLEKPYRVADLRAALTVIFEEPGAGVPPASADDEPTRSAAASGEIPFGGAGA